MSNMSNLHIKLHNGDPLDDAEREVVIKHVLSTRLGRKRFNKPSEAVKIRPSKVITSKVEDIYNLNKNWIR